MGGEGQGDELPRVFGRYVLVERLSRGGMGDIYLALHGLAGFEKFVVIKKIRGNLLDDQLFTSRFTDEAHLAVGLQHANVAQVFEVGRVGREIFLAMEYVAGRDVRRSLKKLAKVGGRLPVDLALYIARETANGLAYAHRYRDAQGEQLHVVHCDVSPPNVMLSFEGEIKIVDFGIARSVDRANTSGKQMGWGKFGYMAPEQLIRGRTVDARTDVYGLAVVLYEMLTGERMYPVGDKLDYKQLAKQVASGEHPLPSDKDPSLARFDALVARGVQPDPNDRYHSASEFRDAIQSELVKVRPTISADDLGLFVRHLFAEERITQKRRIDERTQMSRDREWESVLSAAPETIMLASGHATGHVEEESLATATTVPSAGRPWLVYVLLMAVVGLSIALVVAMLSNDRAEDPDSDPEPIIEKLS